MIAQFIIKRNFNRVSISLYVDCETKEASLMIKEGRLLRQTQDVAFWEVKTPQEAERWLSHQVPVSDGTLPFLEYLDYMAARGLGPFEVRKAV